MKKTELKQLIKEVITEASFNADNNKSFRISYYDDSYQFKQDYFIGSIKDAEKEAKQIIGTNKDFWAIVSEPEKWKEVKRIKN